MRMKCGSTSIRIMGTIVVSAALSNSAFAAEAGPVPLPSPLSALVGGSAMDCAGCYECTDPDRIAYTLTTDPEYDWLSASVYCPSGLWVGENGCDELNSPW